MKPDSVLDTKLTRPTTGRRITNGVAFLGMALVMFFYMWLWDTIQSVLEPVTGFEWSIRITLAGFFVSIFGLGYGLAPFGPRHETEDWDESETVTKTS